MITFYHQDPSSTLVIFIVQNTWHTISTQFSTTQPCSGPTFSGGHSTTYTGITSFDDLSNRPAVSQQVLFPCLHDSCLPVTPVSQTTVSSVTCYGQENSWRGRHTRTCLTGSSGKLTVSTPPLAGAQLSTSTCGEREMRNKNISLTSLVSWRKGVGRCVKSTISFH